MGFHALLQGIFPTQGELRSPTLQADSSLSESPGKPKNTGVGNLSLLQGIFPTQELNWSLLHCRQILYHLSQGWTDNRDLFPVLLLQLILSPCAKGILFSLFSVDEIVNFLGCLDCSNKIPWIEWLRKNWNLLLTFMKLESWGQGACVVGWGPSSRSQASPCNLTWWRGKQSISLNTNKVACSYI